MRICKKIKVSKGSRCFFVGDIHGSYDKLIDALEKNVFNYQKDILVATGDLIDRGDKNKEVLQLLKAPWFFSVRGNHEQMALDALKKEQNDHLDFWFQNGGDWYPNLNKQDLKIVNNLFKSEVNNLPYFIEIAFSSGRKIGVVHADILFDSWLYNVKNAKKSEILKNNLLWGRKRIKSIAHSPLPSLVSGVDAVIFGHTVLEQPYSFGNCIWIDTGAVFGRELTLIESNKAFSMIKNKSDKLPVIL